MAIEIERKFLVNTTIFIEKAYQKDYIQQGFLNSNKERVVRVRIKNDQGFLTIKGVSNASGTSRFEWEKPISLHDAKDLLQLCEKGIIEKYRYLIHHKGFTFEVDEFLGDNAGLIIAEVELKTEKENFEKPDWLGDEVTGNENYYNSNLSKNPFKNWL